MSESIIIAIITASVTLVGGYFATKQQRQKDSDNAKIELIRLQNEMKADLWKRLKKDVEEMTAHIEIVEATAREQAETIGRLETMVREQGAVIGQLRNRVKTLENENGQLKKENERLKRNGKKGM